MLYYDSYRTTNICSVKWYLGKLVFKYRSIFYTWVAT